MKNYHYEPFKNCIELIIQKLQLRVRRTLRFGKRLVVYLKKYIPIILCVTLFEVIIIPIGIQLEKYESWIDGFWDLRNFMLTSLMIATVIGIIDSESKRHKVLLKQYETYERLKYKSEQFVCSLCEVANFQSDMNIFLSEKNFDMFYQKLIEYMEQDLPKIQQKVISDIFLNYSTKELSRELAIKMYFEQYSRALNNVNYALLTNEFIGPIEHAIEQIDSIHNELQMERLLIEEQKSCYTDIQLLKFVDGISRVIYPAIADLRHPWRWDIGKNNKILCRK
ncbi:MAG: hypothetical protein ACLUAP_04265 [Mediterraneibacter faecis]|uniref:hypothetical protein n=1 Tax=Dorea sp. TaxID=2040332 RepID=UPI00096203D3|nr:MAG: hypothetical protein BHV87_12280 [Clostridiales bacterium 36_14]